MNFINLIAITFLFLQVIAPPVALSAMAAPCSRAIYNKYTPLSEWGSPVEKLIERFAPDEFAFWVVGESGTGAEALVDIIHRKSGVRGPLVRLDAMDSHSATEWVAMLTGYKTVPGMAETAKGGTLWIDHAESIPPAGQAVLASIIERKQCRRLETNTFRPVHTRVIFTSEKNPTGARWLSPTLWYASATVLELSPLRAHPERIPTLAQAVLKDLGKTDLDSPTDPKATPALLEKLKGYAWPGNYRELKSALWNWLWFGDHPAVSATALMASPPPLQFENQNRYDAAQIKELAVKAGVLARSHAPFAIFGGPTFEHTLLSRMIHDASVRAQKPFAVFDVYEEIADGENISSKLDKILEETNGGTLVIRHPQALPVDVQFSLLWSLEHQELTVPGKKHQWRTLPLDVRLVLSTNSDLSSYLSDSATSGGSSGTSREVLLPGLYYYMVEHLRFPKPTVGQ